jgi:membrane-associated protease RseP (regulator of RpoE activity)
MILLSSLIIIIFLHELGHLFAAKLCKCGVKTFSVGFGKVLLSRKFGKTVYQIALIPMGGFCELKDELSYSRSKYAFTNKRYSQKVFIALAGIIMNVITGLIAYWIFLLTGNGVFLYFAFYSILIGLSNGLPLPSLDGSFPIAFLFEKKLGKKKLYLILQSLFAKWFKWIMIINVVSLPYIFWLIYTGAVK